MINTHATEQSASEGGSSRISGHDGGSYTGRQVRHGYQRAAIIRNVVHKPG
jgi:hypothetical protein